MNILISRYCNRKCSFCFARQRLGPNAATGEESFMSLENLRKIMAVLKRSGDMSLKLLGGEPTLHPAFPEIVREGLAEGFSVHIFTNGMMPAKTADFLAGLPEDRISLLCNVSPQANDTPRQKERLLYTLQRLTTRVRLGITITTLDDEFDYGIDYIDRFALQRRVRIGIAQPIVGQSNAYLSPSRYREVGRCILNLAEKFHQHSILVGFDCGMTLCMFDEAQIGRLFTISEGLKMVCSPIIDVGPDMDIWHCFPLSEVMIAGFDEFGSRNEMAAHYNRLTKAYRSLGCMPECMTCDFLRSRQCTGGCLAHAMISLKKPTKPALQGAGSGV
jgi:radical SAM protein with 4Fe4S-binding SPASM domain